MITIRNPMACQARTVIADDTGLKVGMLVYLKANTTAGDPCKIAKAGATQTGDVTVEKGILYFIKDDDLAVDFINNPATQSRSLNTGSDNTTDVASGSLCTFWYDKPVVGFTDDSLGASLDPDDFVAGDKVAFVGGLLVKYATAGPPTDGSEDYMGVVYENDGQEVTVMFTKF